jgi:hypothetical protein
MNLSHALAQLFPEADPLRDYTIQDDGDGPYIAAWHLAQAQPTLAELQTASDAYDLAQAQADAAAQALRTQVVTVAQSAVGVVITSLTAAQVRALLAVLLWRAGALTDAGAIRPLAQWAERS